MLNLKLNLPLCHEDFRYSSRILDPQHQLEVSGILHTLANLKPIIYLIFKGI
jgi:hypothetical protein